MPKKEMPRVEYYDEREYEESLVKNYQDKKKQDLKKINQEDNLIN